MTDAAEDAAQPPLQPGSVERAIAIATSRVNDWLASEHPGLSVVLEDGTSIKDTVVQFLRGIPSRVVHWWDWITFFHKEVKHDRKAYLFSLRSVDDRPLSLCIGRIKVRQDHVALEYLERRADALEAKGATLQVAYLFMAQVAAVLELGEVRINKPINAKLVQVYTDAFDMTPVGQKPDGRVDYLVKKVKP